MVIEFANHTKYRATERLAILCPRRGSCQRNFIAYGVCQRRPYLARRVTDVHRLSRRRNFWKYFATHD